MLALRAHLDPHDLRAIAVVPSDVFGCEDRRVRRGHEQQRIHNAPHEVHAPSVERATRRPETRDRDDFGLVFRVVFEYLLLQVLVALGSWVCAFVCEGEEELLERSRIERTSCSML